MAFLGKEYVFEKDENFENFLRAVGVKEEDVAKYAQYRPSTKLEKNGDTYTYTFAAPGRTRAVQFKSGVELDEELREGSTVKSTYTVDGNVVTQVVKRDGKTATFKREYNGDKLIVTATAGHWDGVAKRYYKL
ncbi:fatty acid-binding protein 1-like [Amyelois transitella]|uniref:fatty acid-binding protein 1-like n=1 Tax=Amyelois transitella TaxID=680683 RepID=UPI002990013D|nr:fatty acid-binding protein 1-like [Amyelois transitella]